MSRFLFAAFILTSILLTIFSYAFVDPNLSYLSSLYTGFSLHNRPSASLIFIFIVSFLYLIYFLFVREAHKKNIHLGTVKKVIFITAALLFFSYPAMVSYDIFNYTTTAKVLFGFLENPYIVMPIEFSGQEFLNYTHAANKTALYAPFWLVLTGIPYFLLSWNFILMMFGFKLLVVLFYLLTLYILWKESKDVITVAFFGLNPLVLFETFVGGHNDIVMVFFALLSLILLKERKLFFSMGSLVLSVLIKFATLFLFPVYIYILWQKIRKKAIKWEKVYILSAILMSIIFFLSPIREEIYPWYFIWVLIFVTLTKNTKLYLLSGIFSFCLLLRYVPYMYLGNHFGLTPYIKIGITFGPLFLLAGLFTYLSLASGRKLIK
ncbi:MAG: hypothetical protein ACD_37C00140G0003 [uncultured bacterium]|nr:MAG: hypothetical protein ACD_37C00140G0003 [uncultured bacterium]